MIKFLLLIVCGINLMYSFRIDVNESNMKAYRVARDTSFYRDLESYRHHGIIFDIDPQQPNATKIMQAHVREVCIAVVQYFRLVQK